MIHVPLIIRFPESSGLRYGETSAPVELVDLLPTLASVFGFAKAEDFDGKSLMPLMTGESKQHKSHIFSLAPKDNHQSFAVRTANRKYIVNWNQAESFITSRELYDVESDPNERINLLPPGGKDEAFESLLVAHFDEIMNDAALDQTPSSEMDDVDPHTQDALKALGYIEQQPALAAGEFVELSPLHPANRPRRDTSLLRLRVPQARH